MEFPFVFSVNSSAYRFILQEDSVFFSPSRGWPHFGRLPPAIFSALSSSPMSFYTYSRVSFGRSCTLNWKAINYYNWFKHSLWKGDLLRYAQKRRPQTSRKHAAFGGTNWCPLNPEHHSAMKPSLTSKAESLRNAAACIGASFPILFNNLLCCTSRVLLAL